MAKNRNLPLEFDASQYLNFSPADADVNRVVYPINGIPIDGHFAKVYVAGVHGIHLRNGERLVKTAMQNPKCKVIFYSYDSATNLRNEINLKSLIDLLCSAAQSGSIGVIFAKGEGSQKCLESLLPIFADEDRDKKN